MKLSHLAMTRKNLGRCRHKWHYKWHYKWHHFWISTLLPHNLEVTDMCWWYLIPIFISQVTRISVFPWVCSAMTTPVCPVLHVSSQLLSTQWFCNFKDLCRQSFSWSGSFLETFGHRPKQKNEGICQEVRCRKFCTQSWTHMNTHYSYIIVISPQSCQKLTKLCAPT